MQSSSFITIVLIGDVIGKPGRRILEKHLYQVKLKYKPDIVIANGENSAGGLGITEKTGKELFGAGVDVITGGNHMWDKRESHDFINDNKYVVRPMNYPDQVSGRGFCNFKVREGLFVTIANLQGRVFMEPVVENPFNFVEKWLRSIKSKIVIIDFHAEATAEKQAMGFFLDGKVSAVIGTHTHVPTADHRILANGTAYQTDVGMTGSLDSVIGMKRKPVIDKFRTGINQRWEVAKKNVISDMTIIKIDISTGKTLEIEPLRIFEDKVSYLPG